MLLKTALYFSGAALAVVGAPPPLAAQTQNEEQGPTEEPQRVDRPRAPATPPFGLGGTPQKPAGSLTPQDDDWSALFETIDARSDWPLEDRLRAIPLNADGDVYLSLGVDLRAELEWFDSAQFGIVPGSDAYLNLRGNVYAAVSFMDRVRVIGAVKSGDRLRDRLASSPVESSAPDLHLAFAEVAIGDALGGDKEDLLVRAGRFELHYATGRLISAREGPNIRSDFDGVMVRYRSGPTTTDIFATRAVRDEPGAFNNSSGRENALYGIYSSIATSPSITLDLFAVHSDRDETPFLGGSANEQRTTVGARLARRSPVRQLGYDLAAVYQFGDSDTAGRDRDISAYSVALALNYQFSDEGLQPELDLRVGYTSGDSDPLDDSNGTYRAPFPPGRYFGETTPLGPGNLVGSSLALSMAPADRLTLGVTGLAFWRVDDEDGTYSPPGFPVRGANGNENFVGWEIGVDAAYQLSPTTALTFAAAQFFKGDYLRDNPPASDTKRIALGIAYSF
ncbi:MAG: alginate export family protein [Alteraurantiacibacter sp.]